MQQSKAVRITGTAMLALTVLFCVLPFLSMLSAALQPQGSMPEGIQFTAHPHWENFIDAWNMANITPLLLNSCILVIVVVPCVVIFCSLGGYAFAQLKVPCKGLIYGAVPRRSDHSRSKPWSLRCTTRSVAWAC